MRRLYLSVSLAFAAVLGALALLVAIPASATAFTVSPWAYACGTTVHGNPVTQQDNPGEGACKSSEPGLGNASAALAAGKLTLHKDGPQADDLASGATISGLTTLTAASFDVTGHCGAGAPRLNVVTSDGQTHFFGCSANNTDGHVSMDLTAKGDGSGNGGVVDKNVTSIDFVFDETVPPENGQATAVLSNLNFEGAAATSPSPSTTPTPTATPTAAASATSTPTATPTAATLATTGGGRTPIGVPIGLLLGAFLALAGLTAFAIRRRTA